MRSFVSSPIIHITCMRCGTYTRCSGGSNENNNNKSRHPTADCTPCQNLSLSKFVHVLLSFSFSVSLFLSPLFLPFSLYASIYLRLFFHCLAHFFLSIFLTLSLSLSDYSRRERKGDRKRLRDWVEDYRVEDCWKTKLLLKKRQLV